MQAYQENISAKVSGVLSPVLGVEVTVTDTATGNPAALYSDNGVTPITQPLVTDETGYFGFYAANGDYKLTFASAQVRVDPRFVQLYDPDEDAPLTQQQAAAPSGAERVGGTWFGGISATVAQLATSLGASLIGYVQAGVGAVARALQDKLRETVSVEDYYSPSMGSNWTLAFQRAVTALPAGGVVTFNTPGTVDLTATVVTSDSAPITFVGKGGATVIRKMFNGDMFDLGKKSELRNLKLDGNGGTYTGRGVIFQTGAIDLVSWRRIDKVEMVNMKGYPVEFTVAIAGYGSVISNSYLGAYDGTTAAVKLPDSETNGNRQMVNVYTSGPLFHSGGCNNHYAQGCEGGAPILTSSAVKVRMVGCRIPYSASTPTFDVDGTDTVVVGCTLGVNAINFKSTLANCIWQGNADSGAAPTITDLSNGTNRIQIKRQLYTPTWSSSGTVPALGNGTLGGAWCRDGERCKANGTLNVGSTTTVSGSTTWTMTMPYTAARNHVGSGFIQQSTGGVKQYPVTCLIVANSNVIQFIAAGNTNAVGGASPGAWASGDLFVWDIDFLIK